MVFIDLGESQSPENPSTPFPARVPVQERFLAFCFDLFLLIPCLSFASLLILKPFGDLGDFENVVAFVAVAAVLWVWVNAFFIAVRGATPGKALMKIRVVNIENPSAPPEWDQALLRSVLWMFEMIYVGIPMLGVFMEKWRRPFHDIVSGTVVVSLKVGTDSAPLEHEVSLAKLLFRGANAFLLVWIGTIAIFIAPKVKLVTDRKPASEPGCVDARKYVANENGRIERLIVLFLGKVISQDCLEQEVDLVMDSDSVLERAWASVAMAYMKKTDDKVSRLYVDETCRLATEDSGACRSARQVHAAALGGRDPFSRISENRSLVESWQHLFEQNEPAKIPVQFAEAFPYFVESRRVRQTALGDLIDEAVLDFDEKKSTWPEGLQKNMSAWMCLAQLTAECGDKKIEACEAVLENVTERRKEGEDWDLEETAGWIEYQRCRKVASGSLEEWKDLAVDRPDLYLFAKTLLGAASGEVSHAKLAQMIEDKSLSPVLRSRVWVHLAHDVRKKGDDEGLVLMSKLHVDKNAGLLGVLAEKTVKTDFQKGGRVLLKEDSRQPASERSHK